MKGKSIVVIAALVAGTLASTTPVTGGTIPQKCASSKQKAVGKKEAAKLGCYSKAAAKALPVDTACLMKAESAFMAAFPKADAKGVCEGTESNVEFTIDHCIAQLINVLTPGFCSVTTTQACTQTSDCPSGETCVLSSGKCPAAKLKAAGKNASGKAACWAKATGKGLPTSGSMPDPGFTACLGKADTGLTGAFSKADGSTPCAGTATDAQNIIDPNCIQAVMSQLPPVAPGCGNGIVDPGETCDDGNTVNGDACPASCVIQSCTVNTSTHQTVSLHLTTPPGVIVGGLTLLLDYPEGKVRMPTTTPGTNVLDTPNDQTYELKDALIDSTGTDGIPANGAGPMLQVMFDGCQGQALPVASDYTNTCTIIDAADENGGTIDASMLGCTVTIP